MAQVCHRFPQLLEALARGVIHLTAASLIAPHLTAENVDGLISEAAGKTKRRGKRSGRENEAAGGGVAG